MSNGLKVKRKKRKLMTAEESEQLNIGDIIDVSAEVPVMPRLKLRQVKRGEVIRRLKPHHKFKIIGIGKNGRKWYKVATTLRGQAIEGWVNSVCLIGKCIEISKNCNAIEDDESRRKESVAAEILTVIVIVLVTAGVCLWVLCGM